jgi:hypothetical protein
VVGAGIATTRLALLQVLAEELADGRVDLRVVAERWVQTHRSDPSGVDPETASALDFLERHHSPPESSAAHGPGPLARVLPIALLAFDSPRNLVSATFHAAALTHPDPRSAWSAVAVNVALGSFIQGKRDFVPAVLEVLRGNAVPDALLAAVRRVPLGRRQGLPAPALAATDAVAAVETVFWLAYHEPLLPRGLEALAHSDERTSTFAIAAGALMGARDGAAGISAELLPAETALSDWDALADRLVRVAAPV